MYQQRNLKKHGGKLILVFHLFFFSNNRTRLGKEDTKEYRDRKDRAERLAREIEASPDHAKNASLESSDGTEEEKYSSVVRPGYAGHAGHNSNK